MAIYIRRREFIGTQNSKAKPIAAHLKSCGIWEKFVSVQSRKIALHIPNNESEQVLSVQHGINCRREERQISEPGDATIREKAPNPFHLIRREAVPFANLKTFVPCSPFGRSLFGHGFSFRRLVLPILINACARQTLGSWLAKRGRKDPHQET
jgi:hypothetical protein